MPSRRAPIEAPLTYEQVAKLLTVDKRTLRRMVEAGDWPAPIRIGNQWRWLPSSVREYLDALELVQRIKSARGKLAGDDTDAQTSDKRPERPKSR